MRIAFFGSFWVYLLGNELKREERSLQLVPVVLKSTGDTVHITTSYNLVKKCLQKTKEHTSERKLTTDFFHPNG